MSFCKSFGRKVKSLLKKIDDELEELGPKVLSITRGIKNILSGPVGDIITAIIPGNWDNELRNKAVFALEKAIDKLSILETCKGKTGADKVRCFIEELKKKSPKVQNSLLIKLASLLTDLLHSGQLSENEYDTFIQLQYSLEKEAKN